MLWEYLTSCQTFSTSILIDWLLKSHLCNSNFYDIFLPLQGIRRHWRQQYVEDKQINIQKQSLRSSISLQRHLRWIGKNIFLSDGAENTNIDVEVRKENFFRWKKLRGITYLESVTTKATFLYRRKSIKSETKEGARWAWNIFAIYL